METPKLCRRFYGAYTYFVNSVYQIADKSNKQRLSNLQTITKDSNIGNSVAKIQQPEFVLTWSHYLVLMRIENSEGDYPPDRREKFARLLEAADKYRRKNQYQ